MLWKNGSADNVTGAVRNDRRLPEHKLRVVFATGQWRRPPRSAGTHAMSQSAAVATRPRHGLESNTLAPASRPRCGHRVQIRVIGWPHIRTGELWGLAAQTFDRLMTTVFWRVVLLEDEHVSSNAANRWQQLLHQQHVSVVLSVDFSFRFNEDEVGTAKLGYRDRDHYAYGLAKCGTRA